jgi:hypothetical protein
MIDVPRPIPTLPSEVWHMIGEAVLAKEEHYRTILALSAISRFSRGSMHSLMARVKKNNTLYLSDFGED